MRTRVVAAFAALGSAYVVAIAIADPRDLTRHQPGANIVIQTTAALVALLVAVIAVGRFRQRRQVSELLLVLALAQYAVANLAFTALPLARGVPVTSSGTIWAGTLTRLTGAVLLVAAAHMRDRDVDPPRHRYADEIAVVAATAALTAAALVVASLLPHVPLTAVVPGDRLWDSAPALSAFAAATALASFVAVFGFLRGHADDRADELLAWLAVACVVAAGSQAVTAVSFVESYSTYVSGGGLLKLACYLLLLGGVLREVRGSWRDRAAAAVADERRRIARDLHDGLAQELAFVVTRSRSLARRESSEELWTICSAAERALDESRRAIVALTRDDDEALDVALAHTAEEVGERLGTSVTLELDPDVRVAGGTKEALLRIAREAITNAARHGAATRVHVRLYEDDAIRLRVTDNGRGFDATSPPPPGRLGITGMRERAAAVGGSVTVSSRRGGTDVEVVLP